MHICNNCNSLFCSLPSSPTQTPPLLHRPSPTAQLGHQSLQHHPTNKRPYFHVPYCAGGRGRKVLPSHMPQFQNPGRGLNTIPILSKHPPPLLQPRSLFFSVLLAIFANEEKQEETAGSKTCCALSGDKGECMLCSSILIA